MQMQLVLKTRSKHLTTTCEFCLGLHYSFPGGATPASLRILPCVFHPEVVVILVFSSESRTSRHIKCCESYCSFAGASPVLVQRHTRRVGTLDRTSSRVQSYRDST